MARDVWPDAHGGGPLLDRGLRRFCRGLRCSFAAPACCQARLRGQVGGLARIHSRPCGVLPVALDPSAPAAAALVAWGARAIRLHPDLFCAIAERSGLADRNGGARALYATLGLGAVAGPCATGRHAFGLADPCPEHHAAQSVFLRGLAESPVRLDAARYRPVVAPSATSALALRAAAHVVPNGDLAHVILFGTFAGFALLGGHLIDRRKSREMGAEWQRLRAAVTSAPLISCSVSGGTFL